ncbi:MAG: glycosyltransferase family 87 protein [Candidatus Omnitrophota bacterium]|jgi:hypothetical protein
MTVFRKFINFDFVFAAIMALFIPAMAVVACVRDGRDLRVGLFGVEQVLQKKSPYENPEDPPRAVFRYAPAITILEYPFLLKSKMVAPYKFENITPSILAWYFTEILALIFSALILLKLTPSLPRGMNWRNLKIGILMSLPLIGYELSNCQNKLIALFFVLLAILLFKKKRMLLSAISLAIALTIYIPLVFFGLYFLIKSRGRFIFSFITGVLIVFIIVPSLVWGFQFNYFLLKDWYIRALKPFIFTDSYASYVDLRASNQALPGAIGRMFVSRHSSGALTYSLPPELVHVIIKIFSSGIIFLSCLAVWKRAKPASAEGLGLAIFLILALIIPLYCIYYTWAWLFVIYFMVLNYVTSQETRKIEKKFLLILTSVMFLSTVLIGVAILKQGSFIFWATFLLWVGIVTVLLKGPKCSDPGF